MTYPCCGKSTGHASWCTSTPRMLAGGAVTYTTVTRHVWSVHEKTSLMIDADREATGLHHLYCWCCSCGKYGRWVTRRSQAEQGAKTHARRAR